MLKKIAKRTIHKFSCAYEGLIQGLLYDRSIIVQFLLAFLSIIFFWFFKANWIEWLFILSAIFFVLVTEFMNSAIEDTCDLLVDRYDLQVKEIKDIAAAAVLLAAVYAVIIAGTIIIRRFI